MSKYSIHSCVPTKAVEVLKEICVDAQFFFENGQLSCGIYRSHAAVPLLLQRLGDALVVQNILIIVNKLPTLSIR